MMGRLLQINQFTQILFLEITDPLTAVMLVTSVLLVAVGVWIANQKKVVRTLFKERTRQSEPAQRSRLPFFDRTAVDESRAIDPHILLPISPTEDDPKKLVTIACALKHRYGDKPISVFTALDSHVSGDTEQQAAEVEQNLEHLVKSGDTTNTSFRTETSVGTDISSEIVHSARETQVDLVLMGWDTDQPSTGSTFGTIIDQVLSQTSLPIYLSKPNHQLSRTSKIHVVIPWEIDHHRGFYEAIYNVKQLAAELDASITVYIFGDHQHRYQQLFDLVEIDILAEFQLASSWDDIQSKLAAHTEPDDLVIALAVREGEIGWNDELRAFPTQLTPIPAKSFALFFLREDDPEHDDKFLRTE